MATFLFDNIIFGPVNSRRLGHSLGINLLPNNFKYCSFDCIYCECGWSNREKDKNIVFHSSEKVIIHLEKKLTEMKKNHEPIDTITYAGNGEPTLHPEFPEIIENTIKVRNKIFPNVKIAVLSNGTMVQKPDIFSALNKIEMNILKLDAGTEKTCKLINRPIQEFDFKQYLEKLKEFKGNLIIQSLFIKGKFKGDEIDNTIEREINPWLEHIKAIQPRLVMIYTYHRDTAGKGLQKASPEKLREISEKVNQLGIETQIAD